MSKILQLVILQLQLSISIIEPISNHNITFDWKKIESDKNYQIFKTPQRFKYGVATAGYQVEGNNFRSSDFWWEQVNKRNMTNVSGDACNHWDLNQFKHDVDLAKKIGIDQQRLSIEWSRIELFPGEYDEAAIDKYTQMLKQLKHNGFTTIVTLVHYSLPMWFFDINHFLRKKNIKQFSKHCKKSAKLFDDQIDQQVTFNEPMSYGQTSFINGHNINKFTGEKWFWKFAKNTQDAHVSCRLNIKKVNENAMVGVVLNFRQFEPLQVQDQQTEELFYNVNQLRIGIWFDFLIKGEWEQKGQSHSNSDGKNSIDQIGMNYYSRTIIDMTQCKDCIGKPQNVLKYKQKDVFGIQAEGLLRALRYAKQLNVPIMITENGASDKFNNKSNYRAEWIKKQMYAIKLFIEEDSEKQLIGYNQWSLLDNWEWESGQSLRFGLQQTDFNKQTRALKDDSQPLIELIKYNKNNRSKSDKKLSENENSSMLKKKENKDLINNGIW